MNNTLAGAFLGLVIMLTQQIHSTSLSLSIKPHPLLNTVIRNKIMLKLNVKTLQRIFRGVVKLFLTI